MLFWFFVGVPGFLVPSSLPTKRSKIHHLQGLVVKSLVWLCEMFNVFVLVAHNPGTANKTKKRDDLGRDVVLDGVVMIMYLAFGCYKSCHVF